MKSPINPARDAAIRLLKRGELTQSEVADLAGVSRQVVAYWARVEGLDCPAARWKLIQGLWNEARGHRRL